MIVYDTGYVPLSRGWMGCASLPNSKLELQPMQRLLNMEMREAAIMRDNYTSLNGSRRVGMLAVRNTVQAAFESFIGNDWVPRIDARLKEHFLALSDSNANLGLPIPPSEKYSAALDNLRALVPIVFPDYQTSMLVTNSTHEFKTLLVERVDTVCKDNKWLKLQEWTFWGAVSNLDAHVVQCTAEWGAAAYEFDACATRTATAQLTIVNTLKNMVGLLTSQTTTRGLTGAFMDAIKASNTRPKKNIFKGALSFIIGLISEADKPEVNKLERLPQFMDAYQGYIDAKVNASAAKFQEEANAYIEQIGPLTDTKFCKKPDKVGAAITWRRDAVDRLSHDILAIWLKHTMGALPAHTAEWPIPTTCLKENCAAQRKRVLDEMSDIATALIALKRLIDRVKENKAADLEGGMFMFGEEGLFVKTGDY